MDVPACFASFVSVKIPLFSRFNFSCPGLLSLNERSSQRLKTLIRHPQVCMTQPRRVRYLHDLTFDEIAARRALRVCVCVRTVKHAGIRRISTAQQQQ